MQCGAEAVATVGLAYAERTVVVTDLVPVRDPNLVDLCREHAGRLSPPLGWTVSDRRSLTAGAHA
jgi:hypothetical protein